jgi:hypothetical protein
MTHEEEIVRWNIQRRRCEAMRALVGMLTTLNDLGGMTPNVAIGVANELFDLHIKSITEPWGNYPFLIVEQAFATGTIKGVDAMVDEKKFQAQADQRQAELDATLKAKQPAAGGKPPSGKPKEPGESGLTTKEALTGGTQSRCTKLAKGMQKDA